MKRSADYEAETVNGVVVIRDKNSAGIYDGIRHDGDKFVSFYRIGARDENEAVELAQAALRLGG